MVRVTNSLYGLRERSAEEKQVKSDWPTVLGPGFPPTLWQQHLSLLAGSPYKTATGLPSLFLPLNFHLERLNFLLQSLPCQSSRLVHLLR